jgi:hypothetical protein
MTKDGLKKPNYWGSLTQAATVRLGNYEGEEVRRGGGGGAAAGWGAGGGGAGRPGGAGGGGGGGFGGAARSGSWQRLDTHPEAAANLHSFEPPTPTPTRCTRPSRRCCPSWSPTTSCSAAGTSAASTWPRPWSARRWGGEARQAAGHVHSWRAAGRGAAGPFQPPLAFPTTPSPFCAPFAPKVLDFELQKQLVPYMKDMTPLPGAARGGRLACGRRRPGSEAALCPLPRTSAAAARPLPGSLRPRAPPAHPHF